MQHVNLLLLAALCFFSTIPTLMRKINSPSIRSINDISVQDGLAPAGRFGFKVLTDISNDHHPYNSNDNLRVRKSLKKYIKDILSDRQLLWNCTREESPFEIVRDDIKIIKPSSRYGSVYFESNSIILHVKGNKEDALLVSAHFDSAIESHGATDDGTAIAAMVAVVHALARKTCHKSLDHSVIFLFNNGEEIDLLGGSAFTLHPLFERVRAFVNLEGSGAAEENHASIFRTNSFPMVSRIVETMPYPHASIIANNVMRFLQSDTDYRVYSNKPGVDIAFYSNRYLYHSSYDNINHTSVLALQRMADNLFSIVITLTDGLFLEIIDVDQDLRSSPFALRLSIPSFVYFDRLGVFGVSWTYFDYQLYLFLIIAGGSLFSLVTILQHPFLDSDVKVFTKKSLIPFIICITFVASSFVCPLLFLFFFSWIKSFADASSSIYGNHELFLLSCYPLCLFSFSFVQILFDKLWIWYKTKWIDSAASSMHQPLLHSDSEEESNEESNDESDEEGDCQTFHYDIYEFVPLSLCAFWTLWSGVALFFSLMGVSIFYVFLDFAIFSYLSLIALQFSGERVKPGFLFGITSLFPFLSLQDIICQLELGIPAIVGEGLSPLVVESLFLVLVSFSCMNCLFWTVKIDRTSSMKLYAAFFLILWIPQLVLSPFSATRPFKYDFREIVDLSPASLSSPSTPNIVLSTTIELQVMRWAGHYISDWYKRMNLNAITLPSSLENIDSFYHSFNGSLSIVNDHNSLLGISITSRTPFSITLSLLGSPGSRSCTVYADGVSFLQVFEGNYLLYGNESRLDQSQTLSVHKRSFDDITEDRISIPLTISRPSTSASLTLHCLHSIREHSPFYQRFLSEKPDWTTNGIGLNDGGAFRYARTFAVK